MTDYNYYFDWAATAPGDEEILRKALECSIENWGNPSSLHKAGQEASAKLKEARERCAKALGVKSETIYFTSGGTESDHIPLLSVLSKPSKGSVVISAIEHPAIREMAKMITNCGWKVITVNPDKNGIIQPQAIKDAIQDDTAYVTVMAVNNETGAIQPIYEIADAIEQKANGKKRPHFHVDCVQAAGKIELNLNYKGIDSAAFSAHKICGPRGIGILYLNRDIKSFLRGGGQEKNIRSGTENLFGATAFSLCLEKYFIYTGNTYMENRYKQQIELTSWFIDSISAIKGCTIIPHGRTLKENSDKFSPWVIQASFNGIPGQVMLRALNAKGYCISTGSACSAKHNSRPILDSMQVSSQEKEDAIRLSFGPYTTKEGMEGLLQAIKEISADFN